VLEDHLEVTQMIDLRSYTVDQIEKAHRAAKHADRWAHGHRESDGLRWIVFASESRPDTYHQTHINGLGCDCDRGRRELRCWHILAAALATEKAQAPKSRKRYEDLFGEDDLEAAW
jgi:hypothetical protein